MSELGDMTTEELLAKFPELRKANEMVRRRITALADALADLKANGKPLLKSFSVDYATNTVTLTWWKQ